jgi:hypothetical protein
MAGKNGLAPEVFVFDTASLYRRSGFESGDLLKSAFPSVGAAELRELLVDVVRRHVLPQLDQQVQVLQIPGVHNPVRATSVSGVPVVWTAESGTGPALTPTRVSVKAEDVFACASKRKIPLPQSTV